MRSLGKTVQSRHGLRLLLVAALILSAANILSTYPLTASGGLQLQTHRLSATVSIPRGASGVFSISIKSSCGTDHIGWGPSVTSPTPTVTCDMNNVCTSNGPVLHQSSYHTIGSGGGTFTATATSTTLLTTWTITVTASDVTHCCVVHSVNVFLTVTDFTVAANPASLSIPAGQTGNSTLTATGHNGFTGTLQYSGTISPSAGLSCNLQPAIVTLDSTITSASSTLSCSGTKGTYTITETLTPWSYVTSRNVTITFSVT